ncbi:PQQ-binding-like beta-propeller repeat protein [Amycolatopsis cihanbeyliensis]|uniref:Putative pyrroloquinoline-quinone binding quinoprotein n=1 Tax=Amycolatopsis cihanbeyliensis TaxID=1128664 RepID=A0A542DQ94_AMYCI|nr:PQQ-binding-like beta-propeller repeat protein [Amycolatopsis cihanbeyliensis]TQJ05273.1 putative pyrroloquinoline-quinone binding quinoprotein [Amycolatopsis cihanbeyliensis]
MIVKRWKRGIATLAVTVLTATTFTAADATEAGHWCWDSWAQPNADLSGTRAVNGPINSWTAPFLRPAWSVPIKAPTDRWPGAYAATPVVVRGVVYTQDLDSNVYAIDLRTGRLLWTKMYNSHTNGPNGVAVADGMVFGATLTEAFGLDARTGREIWRHKLTRNTSEAIDMAPGLHDGTVYISTVPSFLDGGNAEGAVGVLWAIDARTGTTRWKWNTVPADLWGRPDINSGGGLWYPPTFDEKGDVYVAVANPNPFVGTEEFPWGSSRPGRNLYSNSVVKLDARTGKVIWHHQVTPHGIYDWDLQNSPILTKVRGRPVVVTSGKTGYVYVLDRATGRLLWETPVGKHNGHDDDHLLAMEGKFDELPTLPLELYPGALGGVAAPGAVDRRTVYVAVNNLSATWENQTTPSLPPLTEGRGELVALDLASGRIKWSHPLDSSPYGGTSLANDVVFTTTFDGVVHAHRTWTGTPVWQAKLPGTSNSPVAISGDTLLAASGWPQNEDERAEIVAYRLDFGWGKYAGAASARC